FNCSSHHRSQLTFFFNAPATPEIYTLSLHDALPISESFCCNKGAWTKTLRKEPRKAWKRRFSSIRSSRPPSKDCPRLMRGSRNCRRKRSTQLLKPFSWTPDSMFTL